MIGHTPQEKTHQSNRPKKTPQERESFISSLQRFSGGGKPNGSQKTSQN